MSSRKKARVSAEKRRELQVAAAVARESLLQTHVTQALELISLAGNRVSVMRMLQIYVRVNALSQADAELVTTRLLATLGGGLEDRAKPVVYVEGEDDVAGDLPFFGVVRERLRGRTLNDLRRWVELHTGSTQVVLLEVHVQHALRFVAMLSESHTVSAALQVYADLVAVPKALADILYVFVLDRLASSELPAEPGATPDPEQVSLFPSQPRRVV